MAVFPILSIPFVVKLIKGRIRKNSDAVLGITGPEGLGKSNLATLLGLLLDNKFDLWNNILYSPAKEELLNKLKTFTKGSVLDLDEAVKVLEKQNWSKQTFIKMVFQVIRGKNLITELLIPRIEDLNEYFRNWRVLVNICVIKRGLAYLQVPDVYNKFDVWNTKVNQETLVRVLGNETVQTAHLSKVLLAFSQFKGFVGFINFPKLPKDVEKQYVYYKDKYSLTNLEEKEVTESKVKEERKHKEKSSVKGFKIAVKEYISQGHSVRECAEHFETTNAIIKYNLGQT